MVGRKKPPRGTSVHRAFRRSRAYPAFDAFLCHNSEDKVEVKRIGLRLLRYGIEPFLDEWSLRPGMSWISLLEEQITRIQCAVVFIGKSGRGPWQDLEIQAFLREFVRRQCPVIPVILPSAKKLPKLPVFLQGMTWIDFRKSCPNPMHHLLWGITGKHWSNGKPNGKV